MQQFLSLADLSCGQSAMIENVRGQGAMYERLYDLGFTPHTPVTCLFASVFGDPRAYRIKETTIALRQSDAGKIDCVLAGGEA